MEIEAREQELITYRLARLTLHRTLVTLYEAGHSTHTLHRLSGMSRSGITAVLRRAGVEMRSHDH